MFYKACQCFISSLDGKQIPQKRHRLSFCHNIQRLDFSAGTVASVVVTGWIVIDLFFNFDQVAIVSYLFYYPFSEHVFLIDDFKPAKKQYL
jgi:hypothetical protein